MWENAFLYTEFVWYFLYQLAPGIHLIIVSEIFKPMTLLFFTVSAFADFEKIWSFRGKSHNYYVLSV